MNRIAIFIEPNLWQKRMILSFFAVGLFSVASMRAEDLTVEELKKAGNLVSEVRAQMESNASLPENYKIYESWDLSLPLTLARIHAWESWRLNESRKRENENIQRWFYSIRHPAFRNTECLIKLLQSGFTEAAFRNYAANVRREHIYTPELRMEMELRKFARESFEAFSECEKETLGYTRETPKKTEMFSRDIRIVQLKHLNVASYVNLASDVKQPIFKLPYSISQILESVATINASIAIDEHTNSVVISDKASSMSVMEELLKSMDEYAGNVLNRKEAQRIFLK